MPTSLANTNLLLAWIQFSLFDELMNCCGIVGNKSMKETSLSLIFTDWSTESISINSDLPIFIDLSIDRFHCHATKNKLETVQWKKPRKWNVMLYIQFLSYLLKRFMHLCRALYGDAILVYRFGSPTWPPEITKNIWSSLFLALSFYSGTSIRAHKHIF